MYRDADKLIDKTSPLHFADPSCGDKPLEFLVGVKSWNCEVWLVFLSHETSKLSDSCIPNSTARDQGVLRVTGRCRYLHLLHPQASLYNKSRSLRCHSAVGFEQNDQMISGGFHQFNLCNNGLNLCRITRSRRPKQRLSSTKDPEVDDWLG